MPGVIIANPDFQQISGSNTAVVTEDGRTLTDSQVVSGSNMATVTTDGRMLNDAQVVSGSNMATVTDDGRMLNNSQIHSGSNMATVTADGRMLNDVQLHSGSNMATVTTDGRILDNSVIYDVSGNHVTTVADGSARRLHVQASLKPGESIILGNKVTPDLSCIVRSYLLFSGSSTMKIDGSVDPKEFIFSSSDTCDLELYELRFVFGAQDILFDGSKFASKSALTNGILISVTANSGSVTNLANIQLNEDFLMFPTPANYLLNNTGPKDILVMGMSLGGAPILKAGTQDKVSVTIRDDCDDSEIATLKAQIFAIKVSGSGA